MFGTEVRSGTTTQGPFVRYGLAMVFTSAAVGLRWLLDPALGDFLPLATLYGAVILVVWLSGSRPAILAAVVGTSRATGSSSSRGEASVRCQPGTSPA